MNADFSYQQYFFVPRFLNKVTFSDGDTFYA